VVLRASRYRAGGFHPFAGARLPTARGGAGEGGALGSEK
jgi:hypothetical protein